MPRIAYTLSLPGLSTTDDLDTVINWGLGADSTAYLAQMLTAPDAHGIDLERTAAVTLRGVRGTHSPLWSIGSPPALRTLAWAVLFSTPGG
ncbi:hypothetical protein [Streptomyces sp. NPDC002676]